MPSSSIITGGAIFVSAIFAIVGVWVNARLQRSFERNEQTRTRLLREESNKYVKDSVNRSTRLLRSPIAPKDKPYTNVPVEDRRIILDHYEYLCAGIRHGDVEEKLARLTEEQIIVGTYHDFEPYILALQSNRMFGPRTYETLQIIAIRWGLLVRRGPFQWVLEVITNKPNFLWSWTRWITKNHLGDDYIFDIEWGMAVAILMSGIAVIGVLVG